MYFFQFSENTETIIIDKKVKRSSQCCYKRHITFWNLITKLFLIKKKPNQDFLQAIPQKKEDFFFLKSDFLQNILDIISPKGIYILGDQFSTFLHLKFRPIFFVILSISLSIIFPLKKVQSQLSYSIKILTLFLTSPKILQTFLLVIF